MWRAILRTIDPFSLQHFKHLIGELQEIKYVDNLNKELVVDILKSIVELVAYGDRHDTSIFECFMEYQILGEFVRVLRNSWTSSIEIPMLHYLSILIQNLDSEHAIYYCFSNEYLNNIILHPYKFERGDIVSYFVSFLRTVSAKLNKGTLCLLVKVEEDIVVSFPLYTEAVKFAWHDERMIQTAVRAITLNIYNASDDMVFKYMTTSTASEYFSDLVLNLRKKCFHLDSIVRSKTVDAYIHEMTNQLHMETDKVIDDLYYFSDIIRVGESRMSRLMTQNLLRSLVLPILLSLLHLSETTGHVYVITSLYVICRLLQVVDGKGLIKSVKVALIYSCTTLNSRSYTVTETVSGANPAGSFADHLKKFEEMANAAFDPEGVESTITNDLIGIVSKDNSYSPPFAVHRVDDVESRRSGMLALICSENCSVLLASMMFLLILSENEDLNRLLSCVMGYTENNIRIEKDMIMTAVLKVLVSPSAVSVLAQWNAGWVMKQLLRYKEMELSNHHIDLFNISVKQSNEGLVRELNECWFDYVPVTLGNEWETCKRDLDASSLAKDPFGILEIYLDEVIPTEVRSYTDVEGEMSSSRDWQRMVDAVKVFILHHLLEACICGRDSQDDALQLLRSTGTLSYKGLDMTYGTQIGLGHGFPCKIAFSNAEQRDVFVVPVAKGISGKLLLAEKLPLHTHSGVVIAMAPLAGLSPRIDGNHPSWLHLRVRAFDPIANARNTGQYHSSAIDHMADGRWTLAFPNASVCDAALSVILNETCKQRSSVEILLGSLIEKHYP